MVTLNQASLYDWLSRADCGDKERSIGYWQASRKALLQNGVEAKRRAEVCLSHSALLEPFYLGYAYEALGRSAWVSGRQTAALAVVKQGEAYALLVKRRHERDYLCHDLEELRQALSMPKPTKAGTR